MTICDIIENARAFNGNTNRQENYLDVSFSIGLHNNKYFKIFIDDVKKANRLQSYMVDQASGSITLVIRQDEIKEHEKPMYEVDDQHSAIMQALGFLGCSISEQNTATYTLSKMWKDEQGGELNPHGKTTYSLSFSCQDSRYLVICHGWREVTDMRIASYATPLHMAQEAINEIKADFINK